MRWVWCGQDSSLQAGMWLCGQKPGQGVLASSVLVQYLLFRSTPRFTAGFLLDIFIRIW